MSEIRLEQVGKVYAGDVRAVDDVNLAIGSGEFMVLVGPSGCGKSTLLRMIAGLEEVTDGEIWIGDREVSRLAPRDRDIAMVFQNYALYPHLSVAKNLGYGLKVRKTPKRRDRAAGRGGRANARARGAARPAPGRALGRAATARRDGPRDRARAGCVPDGRAALEPRREVARRHARRARPSARPARGHDRVRDARPGRGDDARDTGRGYARRHLAAGRHAAAALPRASEPLRRRVHRLALDEPRRSRARRRHGRVRRITAPAEPDPASGLVRGPDGDPRDQAPGLRRRASCS